MPRTKKTPVTSRGSDDLFAAQGSILNRLFKSSTKPPNPSISLYNSGIALEKPVSKAGTKKGGGIRGEIQGWSSASRRRMREWLLTHEPIANYKAVGITFTIPGPPVSVQVAKDLWHNFTNDFLHDHHIGTCWRIEIQKRGSFHWHVLAAIPDACEGSGDVRKQFLNILLGWLQYLDKLGKIDHVTESYTQLGCFRSQLLGAYRHAVDFDVQGSNGAWLRYLQDHATKSKQEQCPEYCGKHWGVTGSKFFAVSPCASFLQFPSDASFCRFLRAFQRLCTPQMSHAPSRARAPLKFSSRPFGGRSLGWRIRRGSLGRTVWFSRPETVRRLYDWSCDRQHAAIGEDQPTIREGKKENHASPGL